MIFLSSRGVVSGSMLIFRGVICCVITPENVLGQIPYKDLLNGFFSVKDAQKISPTLVEVFWTSIESRVVGILEDKNPEVVGILRLGFLLVKGKKT